jgi:hypothetical protein
MALMYTEMGIIYIAHLQQNQRGVGIILG